MKGNNVLSKNNVKKWFSWKKMKNLLKTIFARYFLVHEK